MVESRGSCSGKAGCLLRQSGRWTGSTQWQLGRRRSQKPTGLRVEEGLSCVGLPVCACRPAVFPGLEAHSDSVDHALEVGRKRV